MNFLFRLVKNINEDVVYAMKCEDVNDILSVNCQGFGDLVKSRDYKVVPDALTFFLIITKKLISLQKHYLTIKVSDKDNKEQDWKVSCKPKGQWLSFSSNS